MYKRIEKLVSKGLNKIPEQLKEKKSRHEKILSEIQNYLNYIKTGKFNPDLLIMDIRMPKIDGLEVCRRLRQDTTLSPGMKIIAITAHSNKYDRDTVLASGADEFLIKPLDMQTLQEHVEKLLFGE